MKKATGRVLIILFVSLVFCLSAGIGETEETSSKVLATIDEIKITQADFEAYLDLFKDQSKYRPTTPAAREKLLNNLIERTLLLDEAKKKGYFEADDLKKHGSLNSRERETMVLRQFLTDRVSRPATIDDSTVKNYLETHPGLTFEQAQEKLTSERQLEIYKELMQELKRDREITIHSPD